METAACQASLSFTISQSLPMFMSIKSVMPSNHLILCLPLLLLPSIFPSTRVFSNESAVHIRWPKYLFYIYIYMSKHQVVHLKYIQFFNCQLYLNKLGKKFFPKNNFSKSYLKPRLILGKCQCLVIPQSLILDPR